MRKSKLPKEVDVKKTAQVTLSYLRERRVDGVNMSLKKAVSRCSNDNMQVQESVFQCAKELLKEEQTKSKDDNSNDRRCLGTIKRTYSGKRDKCNDTDDEGSVSEGKITMVSIATTTILLILYQFAIKGDSGGRPVFEKHLYDESRSNEYQKNDGFVQSDNEEIQYEQEVEKWECDTPSSMIDNNIMHLRPLRRKDEYEDLTKEHDEEEEERFEDDLSGDLNSFGSKGSVTSIETKDNDNGIKRTAKTNKQDGDETFCPSDTEESTSESEEDDKEDNNKWDGGCEREKGQTTLENSFSFTVLSNRRNGRAHGKN